MGEERSLRVAVLVDGRHPQRGNLSRDPHAFTQASVTVKAVSEALSQLGHTPLLLETSNNLLQELRDLAPDLVFNLATGLGHKKQQANVVAILELAEVPFTGSPLESHVLALHKPIAKMVFRHWGIPTPAFQVIHDAGQPLQPELRFPLIVKPTSEGSSVGIGPESVVHDEVQLRAAVARVVETFAQPAIVEEFAPGREFTVGIVGNDPAEALPPEEIVFLHDGDAATFGYLTKQRDTVTHVCPAELPPDLRHRIDRIALLAYHALGCCDYARIDIRMDDRGEPLVLEVNTIPGLQPGYSELPRIAEAAGMSYVQLIDRIMREALTRHRGSRRQAGFLCTDPTAFVDGSTGQLPGPGHGSTGEARRTDHPA